MRRHWLAAVLSVAAILVFAAIWPRRLVDGPRPEAQAIAAMRTIYTAQTQYYSQYGRYATSLRELGPPDAGLASAAAAGLIGAALASGSVGGCKFSLTGAAGTFAITASSGVKSFYLDQTGILRACEGQEPATSTSPEFAK
jgi:hypothetical protein